MKRIVEIVSLVMLTVLLAFSQDPPPTGKLELKEQSKFRLLFLYQRAVNTNTEMNNAIAENRRAIDAFNTAVKEEILANHLPSGTILKPNLAGDAIEITLPNAEVKQMPGTPAPSPPKKEPQK